MNLDEQGITVREVTFEQIKDDWLRLEQDNDIPSIYQTFDWQYLWWNHYHSPGMRPLLLAAAYHDRVIGIAPLYRDKIGLYGVPFFNIIRHIGARNFDYTEFACGQDLVVQLCRKWLEYLGQRYPHDTLYLTDMPEPFYLRFRSAMGPYKHNSVYRDAPCPVVDLPPTPNEYYRSLGAATRKNIRNQQNYWSRLLASGNAQLTTSIAYDNEMADALFQLHRRRWDVRGDDPGFALLDNYERDLMKMLGSKGVLRQMMLKADGRPVGAMFMYDFAGKRYFHKGGFDPAFSRFSPGTFLIYQSIVDAVSAGLTTYDFLRGDEVYKSHFCSRRIQCFRAIAARNRRSISILNFLIN